MASPYDRVPPPSRRKPTQLPVPPQIPRPYTNGVHGQFVPPRPRPTPEEAFPPELQRRGSRGFPQQQYRQQPEPEYIDQKRQEVDEYYRQFYEGGAVPPMPKKQKTSKIDLALLIGYVIVFAAGIGGAVLSFTYARGSTQLPMSISFIHLELAALLVCQLFIALLVWRRG